MFVYAVLISWCAAGVLVAGLPGDLPPSHLPAMLVSGRNVNGTSMIIRHDGYPDTWIHVYRNGGFFPFTSITGTNPTLTAFRALAVHHENGVILWSNPLQKDIEWMPNFLHGEVAISDVHLAASSEVNGMAADWLSHNLYWADTANRMITLSSISDPHLAQGQSPYHKRVLDASDGLQEPWDVAVDPMKGKLYWTDAGKRTVNVANLAGNNRRVLYQAAPGERPTSLCLDTAAQLLYWIDENHMAIISMTTAGTEVTHLHDYVEEYFVYLRGLAVYGDYLFTTGTSQNAGDRIIFVVNRNNVHDNVRLNMGSSWLGIEELYDVAFLAPQPQLDVGTSPICDDVQCSHICVGYQDDGHASCLCADGYTLQADMFCERDTHNVQPSPPTPVPSTPRSAVASGVGGQSTEHPMTAGSTDTSSGGMDKHVVIAVAVSVVGLVAICAILALLACFVLRHRRKVARENSLTTATPTPVIVQAQHVNNPTYGSSVGAEAELPPSYMHAMAEPPPPEHSYENLAFNAENQDEKKEKI